MGLGEPVTVPTAGAVSNAVFNALGVQLRDYVAANPGFEGVMLAGHGIICWADNARACYEHTIGLIADAAEYLNGKLSGRPAFSGAIISASPNRATASPETLLPVAPSAGRRRWDSESAF